MTKAQRIALVLLSSIDAAILATGMVIDALAWKPQDVAIGLALVVGGVLAGIPLLHMWIDPR